MDDEAIQMLVDNDRFLVTTRRLAEAMDVSQRSEGVAGQGRRDVPEGARRRSRPPTRPG